MPLLISLLKPPGLSHANHFLYVPLVPQDLPVVT